MFSRLTSSAGMENDGCRSLLAHSAARSRSLRLSQDPTPETLPHLHADTLCPEHPEPNLAAHRFGRSGCDAHVGGGHRGRGAGFRKLAWVKNSAELL